MYMKVKSLLLYFTISLTTLTFSCDSYLNKEPDDMQTLEGVFSKRASTEQYLANVLGYLPDQYDAVCLQSNNYYGWPFVPASDEAEWGAVRVYAQMQNGTLSASNPSTNFWVPLYRGIRESNVFLENVSKCQELASGELERWTAEARYVNVMCHYWLAMLYGPVVLVKDEVLDLNSTVYRERNTWEECVEWITGELNAVAYDLPVNQEDIYAGRPTRGAAIAHRARFLLYAASPLFNGNPYFSTAKNKDGTNLFPTSKNPEKWQVAANAAKQFIDMCEGGSLPYKLLTGATEDNQIGKTYKRVFVDEWNTELIDAEYLGGNGNSYVYLLEQGPAPNGDRFLYGHATNCVTQFQVDAYAMANGKYPITGYNNDGSPQIDETSGYSESGFSGFHVPTFNSSYSGYDGTAFNMYKGREPRFYASVFYNEGVWPHTVTNQPIYIQKYGTDGSNSFDYNRTGYLITKFVHPSSVMGASTSLYYNRSWSNLRYAEILLNYVEAKIELNELTSDVLAYWNAVRSRAGMPNIESVYPEVTTVQTKARDLIHRERQVEFAFENLRWFDANRWKIAANTNHGKTYGMNVNVTSASPSVWRGEFYQRTAFETRVFLERQYLQPIPQTAIMKNPVLIQNPGW
jgi:hypothetical protein